MAVTIEKSQARAAFRRAAALAASGHSLPLRWLQIAEAMARSPNKTFVAMLGTGLLARATTSAVEPTALKADPEVPPSSGLQPYSARGLAQHVLVPEALLAGIHLGVTGREPLNNAPFYKQDYVDPGLVVKSHVRPHLKHLVDALEGLRGTSTEEAEQALAAFIRVRRAVQLTREARVELGASRMPFAALVAATHSFVTTDPEGGKRGQAFVAAALDMVFDDVRTGRINDPSRHGAGDVRVFEGGEQVLSAEVKQKPATETDLLLFAASLKQTGPLAGIYAALATTQPDLNMPSIEAAAMDDYGVVLKVYLRVETLLRAAYLWSSRAPGDFVDAFPPALHARLTEIEVASTSLDEWAEYFA